MASVRTIRVVNPHKSRRKTRRQSNPGGGVLTIMANPRTSRKKSYKSRSRRHASRNPFGFGRKKRYGFRRRHRNPSGIAGFNSKELLSLVLGGVGGLIITKAGTQLILQDKNQGPTGYAVSAAVALGAGWGAHKFGLGKNTAVGIAVGGLIGVVLRYYQENVSQTMPAMSGLGDADVAGLLGTYMPGTYPVPFWTYGSQAVLPNALPAAQVIRGSRRTA
jgi:hypothetical protein